MIDRSRSFPNGPGISAAGSQRAPELTARGLPIALSDPGGGWTMIVTNPWAEMIEPCYRATSFARTLVWRELWVSVGTAPLTVLQVTSLEGSSSTAPSRYGTGS